MSELTQKQWAVISERGCEVSGVSYEEAVQRIGELKRQKVHGLSVISNDAARRLTNASQQEDTREVPNNSSRTTTS